MKKIALTILVLFVTVVTSYSQVDVVCLGSTSESYSITPNASSVYTWQVIGGGNIVGTSTGNSIIVDWSSILTPTLIAGAVILTETNAAGCSEDAFLDVNIVDNPNLNVTAVNSIICIGDAIVLTASAGYDTYTWTPTVGFTGNTGTYTPTDLFDNSFSVVATNTNGCSSSGSVNIIINALPVITATMSETEICVGDDVVISANTGMVTYDWSPAVISGNTGTFTPVLGVTDYSVEVTDANGCIATDDVSLVINDLPIVDLTVDGANTTTICLGESIDLLATSGLSTYSWTPAVVAANPGGVYTPSSDLETTYSVTATDASGCENSDNVIITINNIPNPGPIIFN